MAFSENRTRKIRRWRINVAAATAAAPATKNNKIISSKRFDTFALWHLKVKRKHINTLIDVFNRANHALLLLSFYCNFHQGCNCFFLSSVGWLSRGRRQFFEERWRKRTTFKSVLSVRWFIVCSTKKVIWLPELTMFCYVLYIFFKKKIRLKV